MKTPFRTLFIVAALAGIATTSACDAETDSGEMSTFRAGPGGSGGGMGNTHVIDTSDIAAIDTQGAWLDGVRLRRVQILIGGVPTTIKEGSLRVKDGTVIGNVGATKYAGMDFSNSIWSFQAGGSEVTATLTKVDNSDDAGFYDPLNDDELLKLDPDRLVYSFTYENGSKPIATCPEDTAGGARLVLFGDINVNHNNGDITQRDDTIYFGCLSGVVGKTALYGYAPDSPTATSVSLDEFNLATRALRADYCADGTSFTAEGNLVTFRDRYGINAHTEAGFNDEALWGPNGVVCLNRIRLTGDPVAAFTCGGVPVPLCGPQAAVNNRWTSNVGTFWTKIE